MTVNTHNYPIRVPWLDQLVKLLMQILDAVPENQLSNLRSNPEAGNVHMVVSWTRVLDPGVNIALGVKNFLHSALLFISLYSYITKQRQNQNVKRYLFLIMCILHAKALKNYVH